MPVRWNYATNKKIINETTFWNYSIFSCDIEASKTAKLTMLNRNTINKYYKLLCNELYSHSPRKYYLSNTTCEIDESYFGAKRFHKDGKLQGLKK